MMKKIMVLGDGLSMGVRSNQENDNGIGGYRLPLWNALVSNGFDIDFVGTLNHGNTLNTTSPVTFDSDHMGIRRWRVEDLLNGIDPEGPLQNPATEINTQNIDDWITQYTPDVVLLMAGLNDVTLQFRGLDDASRLRTADELADETIDELRSLIQKITATGADVLLASPPALFLQLDGTISESAVQDATASVKALADRIPALAQEFSSKVTFVDIFNEIDQDKSISANGRFLTDEIYNQIASSWYNALVPILEPTVNQPTREKAVVIEAEDFDSIDPSYQTETVSGTTATVLSVSHLRPFRSSENVAAAATTAPNLPAGKYDIILTYFDQKDSQSQYQVRIENTIFPAFKTNIGNEAKTFTSTADDQLKIFDSPKNYTLKTIATGVDIFSSDRVTINFLSDKGENLSFDNIRFVRVGDTDASPDINTQPGGNPNIDNSSGIGRGTTDSANGSNDGPVVDIVTGETAEINDGAGETVDIGDVAEAFKISFQGNKGKRIIGTQKKDNLKGTRQNDVIKGKNGNDKMNGKGGNDRAFGGSGNDNIKGGGGSDFLKGDAGKDKLTGGGGNDILWGGNDNNRDILRGGGGKDAFQFKRLMDKADTIIGFKPGTDIIDMRRVLSGNQYAADSGFEKFTEFIQLVTVNGNTEIRVDSDGLNGDGEFKALAVLKGVQSDALASTDFAI